MSRRTSRHTAGDDAVQRVPNAVISPLFQHHCSILLARLPQSEDHPGVTAPAPNDRSIKVQSFLQRRGHRATCQFALLVAIAFGVSPSARAQYSLEGAIAVNALTNKIYVANGPGNYVTVIDGAANSVAIVPTGLDPDAIAVNELTNTIYVANLGYGNGGGPVPSSVTVIDGATNATTSIPVGTDATDVAVNMVTNKIYVTTSGVVTVIDGVTNAVTNVPAGTPQGGGPVAVAVNAATNRIYVVDQVPEYTNAVTVIDGDTNATTNVPVGIYAGYVAVNSATNKIYVANIASSSVSVIDGVTNATITVPTGTNPHGIAVNPVTNRIYTTNVTSGDVTVIDGATNATTTVPMQATPTAIAVNPLTNTIYVTTNQPGGGVTVIDGATNAITTVADGTGPFALAVNPVTNTTYVADGSAEGATAIPGPTPAQVGARSSARLINISTRAQVGTGGSILIPGFEIAGTGTETLLIRADGPSLTQFGVAGVLAQPILDLFDSTGRLISANTGWGTNSSPAQIASTSAQVGAFALAAGSSDSALIANLPPGAYTVQISGVSGTTGVALAEIYEVSSTGTRLANISTRAQVGTAGNIVIPGFVISGNGTDELLVRADGPSLAQYGVSGFLTQPSLSVFNSGGSVIASNTGWTSAGIDMIAGFDATVGAFSLTPGSADSAQIVSLPTGAYTIQVSGVENSTGVALAEIYLVP